MVLVLIQLQGPWLIFKVQQYFIRVEIKSEIKSGIPADQLVKLAIAKAWEEQKNPRFEREHSKEFRFDGEWYDVIKHEQIGDTTYYWCIHDFKESALFATLEHLTYELLFENENEDERKEITEWLIQKYEAHSIFSNVNSNSELLLFIEQNETMLSAHSELPSPPPDALIA